MASITQTYNLGFILDKAGTRLETKLSEINYITQFFLNTNYIRNIVPNYIQIDFVLDTDAQIAQKLTNDNINYWITAVENPKVQRLWDSFFKNSPINGNEKLLFSICDDLASLQPFQNVLHINNISNALLAQFEKIIWNRISVFESQSYLNIYIVYENHYQNMAFKLESLFSADDVQNQKTYFLVNSSNLVAYSQFITKITNDVLSGKLTYDNTLFIYLQDSYNVYFEVFNIVENPILLADPIIQANYRHYLWYQSYINTGYIECYNQMKQYLSAKFGLNTISDYSSFFRNKLRAFVPAQCLTKFQNDKYNYLNYVYYVRNPVSEEFLKQHRITIYTVLLEKAITLAKEILYRDVPSLDQLYSRSIYTDGRVFGPLNFNLTGYAIDNGFFNQTVMVSYPLCDLYYITEIQLKSVKTILKETNLEDIQSAVSYIPTQLS